MSTVHITFTGGGTGGHIFPILAVAEELVKTASALGVTLRFTYVGPARGPIDVDIPMFQEKGIDVRDVNGAASGRGIMRVFVMLAGFFRSLWHLYFIMPDIIFSKGGYGAAPVLAAAVFYRIPIFVHESDVIPGKTNALSARFAKRIAVSFAETTKFFPQKKTVVLGNPMRTIFLTAVAQQEAKERLGLVAERKTVFVVGGSQGAKALNDVILDILPYLLKEYQVIHQCGARNFGDVQKEASFTLEGLGREYGAYYKVYGFLSEENLRDAYSASDIVVSRAGSGSIFELAAQEKPAILIPFRFAAQNHQRANAYAYAETGAALVLEEENFTPHILLAEIKKVLDLTELTEKMRNAARAFARPDASRKIAEELLQSAGVAISN